MQVVIPAAGLGRRFLPRFPKEMLLLGDRPLIDHALGEAARAGFTAAVVVISPAKSALADHLQTSANPLPVSIVEQPLPLGPGDAVLRSAEAIGEAEFGVLYPDDIVLDDGHWAKLREAAQGGAAALCVREVPLTGIERFGIAECENDAGRLVVRRLLEKPKPGLTASSLAIFGRYIVNAAVLEGLAAAAEDGELQLTAGFDSAARQPPGVIAVPFEGEIFDCGTPEEYDRAQRSFPVPFAPV